MKQFLYILVLFISANLYSQEKEFVLGFTGAPHQLFYTRNGNPTVYEYWQHWNWYSELSMNMWQGWAAGSNPYHYVALDSLKKQNMKGFFQPDTLLYLALGKVMTYDAGITDNKYCFNSHSLGEDINETIEGKSVKVRFFNKSLSEGQSFPRLVLEGLSENGEYSFSGPTYDPAYQPVLYEAKKSNIYYVKPRMKIVPEDAKLNKPVVRIDVKDYSGANTIMSRLITTADFKNISGNSYDGSYIEDFTDASGLSFSGEVLNRARNHNFLTWDKAGESRMDIQVFWYGEVNVWIDYIKIIDEPANKLFYDKSYRDYIRNKIDTLFKRDGSANPSLKGFYTEEVGYSNLTSLKYLQDFFKDSLGVFSNDPRANMVCLFNPWAFQANLKDKDNDRGLEDYLRIVNPSVLMLEWYPFQGAGGDFARVIPSNVNFYAREDMPRYIFNKAGNTFNSSKVTKEKYNTELQKMWKATADTIQYFSDAAKKVNKDFYIVSQVHSWQNGEFNEPSSREPMNSELEALNCISICRGVNGIMPFEFETFYDVKGNPSDGNSPRNFSYGMLDSVQELRGLNAREPGFVKRTLNFYGENKWDAVKNLFAKIKRWGTVIANSINTSGYSVNSEGANHNFINDIISLQRNSSGSYSSEDAVKYWEMGFFNPADVNDKAKYFMMVNRRCIPETEPGDGDLRQLKIKFNVNDLVGFNSWKVIDVNANSVVLSISTGNNSFYDFGIFQPGEGRLYKLEPVN